MLVERVLERHGLELQRLLFGEQLGKRRCGDVAHLPDPRRVTQHESRLVQCAPRHGDNAPMARIELV